jgi:hypothetical protein
MPADDKNREAIAEMNSNLSLSGIVNSAVLYRIRIPMSGSFEDSIAP